MKKFIFIILILIFGSYAYSQVPNPPVLISPPDSATICTLTPQLDWSDVTGATSYRLQISKHYNFDTLVLDSPGLTNSAYNVICGLLSYNTTYYWRVNVTTSGGTSNWSTIWRFITGPPTPSVPVVLTPIIDTTGSQIHVTFRWRTTANATFYRLQISIDSTFITGIRDTTTSDTILTLSGFSFSASYYWRLRGGNICGYGLSTPVYHLVTVLPPLTAPFLIYPPNGAINTSVTPDFQWTAVTGATYYRIQVATDSLFIYKVIDTTLSSGYNFPGVPLNGQTLYYWRVCAGNNGGQGPWSAIFHFTTALTPPPQAPALISPFPGSHKRSPVLLDWSDVNGAAYYKVQVSTDIFFTQPVIDTNVVPSYVWVNLSPGFYYWRVHATNTAGSGPWSAVWSFWVVPSYSVSGTVRYNDNNQIVISGMVKAFQLNKNDGSVSYLDSAQIQSNGTYTLQYVPQDSVDIGVFPNSTPPNDYVITYYPSTIYWQNSTMLYPTSNLTNINIFAIRSANSTANNSVNGKVMQLTDVSLSNIKDAFLYAKSGNSFVRCAISDTSGIYHLQSLPTGNLKIIVSRLGFSGDSVNVNVTPTSNIDSVNFYLNKIYVGIKKVNNIVPTEYKLFQNYPNPFNPTTNIKYQITNNSPQQVTIKIFDILGKEIATLVNEVQSPGIYEIIWDASHFPSGVYFYKLTTDNFVDTKKMLMIK